MLTNISIRDFVLIDSLSLDLGAGLSVLTGETGAGKSILLDAIGLALGLRASQGLVRAGAKQASVSVTFELPRRHPVYHELRELDLPVSDDELILRRTFQEGGRSRVFINDVPTSVQALKRLGPALIEIQGQFDAHGLLDPQTHRAILIDFAKAEGDAARVSQAWRAFKDAEGKLVQAQEDIARGVQEQDYLRFSVNELETLNPQVGEEDSLSARRQVLMNAEALRDTAAEALDVLAQGEANAENLVNHALGTLDRIRPKVGELLEPVIETLSAASAEIAAAVDQLRHLEVGQDADELAQVDERLFSLRDLARKHGVPSDLLPEVLARQQSALAGIDNQSDHLARLEREVSERLADYQTCDAQLSNKLRAQAQRLDKIVQTELPKIKLENALFITTLTELDEHRHGEHGSLAVQFQATTNPGNPPGPINRVASGGELSRFLLALKVALASDNPLPTLIFDEVDAGVGGATAAAVGERLSQLAKTVQVLTVTHSPQVAAKGRHHFQLSKQVEKGMTTTQVTSLGPTQRQHEIARMLAGDSVTPQAIAAAKELMGS